MDIEKKLKSVPNHPGAYLIKDDEGNILYVGKASSLRKRLRQHFRDEAKGGPWHQIMISRAVGFDFILARSGLEALILEANLIKEHHPQFNVQLADDKSYPYIKITDELFPRLMLVRDLPKNARPASGRTIRRGFHDPKRQEVHYLSSGKVFGPYPNGKAMRRTMRLASQLFGIRSCRKDLDGSQVGRPCLNYHIKRCVGPCTGEVSQEEYAKLVRQVELFLAGRSDQIVDQLEEQMQRAAEQLRFERAAVLRDKLSSLRRVLEDQVMASTDARDEDVIAAATDEQRALVVLMTVRAGKLVNQQRFPL
ncbi:MAG: UvrB/UvrC motif-containing protein, partial [Armatimonadetes bacterium]|nr:UvrB/UvrC motif-containing protein [Armatimonadota bacterium]